MSTSDPVERAWRTERATIVASLVRRLADLDLAEDAVQDAFAAAATRWPREGVPGNPGAWLTTVAWRRALDVVRRERRTVALPADLDAPSAPPDALEVLHADGEPVDDLLGLVLACCHPALAPEARVALTLRHVAGLTAGEIAAAFVVSGDTMAKRLVRARAKLRDAAVSFAVPDARALPARLGDARAVVYLVYTEGHLASVEGPLVRGELCDEAVWLARQLHTLVPGDAETAGLLALLLFLQARRPARIDGESVVALDAQDRSRWDDALAVEARQVLGAAYGAPLGPYQVEAAIAALHAAAPSVEATDWGQIAALYGVLGRLAPSPVVAVNRAVAVGRADGAEAGLSVLAPVLAEGRLADYVPLHAAHADLLARSGDADGARAAWRRAADLADNDTQRRHFLDRAEEM